MLREIFPIKILKNIDKKLGLPYIPEKEADGNVCVAKSPDVRDEYKDSYAKNLLDYMYAVLHSPRYLKKYKDLSKIDVVELPHLTD